MQRHFNKLCVKLCVNQNKGVLIPVLNIVDILEFAVDPALLLSALYCWIFLPRFCALFSADHVLLVLPLCDCNAPLNFYLGLLLGVRLLDH